MPGKYLVGMSARNVILTEHYDQFVKEQASSEHFQLV